MDIKTVLYYGHRTVLNAVEGLDESDWETPGVCGVWSVKDIIAHLASYEHLLVDVLHAVLHYDVPTPALYRYEKFGTDFNDVEVARYAGMSVRAIMGDYEDTCAETLALIGHIAPQALRRKGSLPFYGDEYDLEDFLVYRYYGHKREHCAQIAVFRDELEKAVEATRI